MNAKLEFIKEVTNNPRVLCVYIEKEIDFNDSTKFLLKVGYSDDEYNRFLDSLNFEYDNGFGGQELYGKIWYVDGSWSERKEYDGSEWWETKFTPKIPNELK